MKPFTYVSICSGIESATVAWHPLGWSPICFSEIDPFCNALLKHHYPQVPNIGDFTKPKAQDFLQSARFDLLVGGTPCQDFSVAGKRKGITGSRGSLTVRFLETLSRCRPQWFVWENVPGVMSLERGRVFGSLLWAMGQCGYGVAYRVLDAQYFGVPQRRRRVFVVGHLGDWRPAAAVLFERFSLSGHPPPSRKTRKDVAPTISARTKGGGGLGTDFDLDGGLISHCLNAHGGAGRMDAESETFVTHALRADGFDASEDGTGRGTPLVAAIAIPILEAGARTGKSTTDRRAGIGIGEEGDPMFTLQAGKQHAVGVRRLTPRECERLQGFPDRYTLIPYRGKPAADGPRYKAIGNSKAVPVVRWIGERIQLVERNLT